MGAVSALTLVGCGDGPSTPSLPDFWSVGVVTCENCPGLSNAEFVAGTPAYRARLRTGQLTSVVLTLCGIDRPGRDPDGQVVRWLIGDPDVISVTPSGTGSATIAALRPGVSTLAAEVRTPDGRVHQAPMLHSRIPVSRCGDLPPLVWEIVP